MLPSCAVAPLICYPSDDPTGAGYGEAAAGELAAFETGPWSEKYPAIAQSWRRNWEEVIPFFAFSSEGRKIIYTTKHHQRHRVAAAWSTKSSNKGHFPSDQAAKFIYLALRAIKAKWKRPPKESRATKTQLAIQLGERFTIDI